MPNLVQTYVIHDTDPSAHGGAIRINRAEAKKWNEKGFGVFHTVQEFFHKRRISNLRHINAWAVDLDGGTKEDMLKTILSGLVPTMIVETKNGFHVYWKAKDATAENWRPIMEHRLVPFYKADKKAKDLARILRTPGFYHMKNPTDPFLVKVVHYKHVEYTEREMFRRYKDLVTLNKQTKLHKQTQKSFGTSIVNTPSASSPDQTMSEVSPTISGRTSAAPRTSMSTGSRPVAG
jgi:hypothetical protein